VIVAIAGWLYIVEAILILGSLFSGPVGGGLAKLATLLMAALCAAIGVGLLKRDPRARWLALGSSLLGWVFGSLMIIGVLAVLAMFGKEASSMFGGGFAILAVVVAIFLLFMLVGVVICFKLFFHLCSQEGCEEFGVPYGSAGTVVASVAAWIGISIAQSVMASGGAGGLGMLALSQAMSSREESREPEQDPEQMQLEAERRAYAQRYEEEQRHREQEERLRQIRAGEVAEDTPTDAVAADAAAEPEVVDTGYDQVVARQARAIEASSTEARAPSLSEPVEEERTSANQILKCRDASGAVTFTQGYCPPGSQRVDMPRSE